jgi:hypothetical protein
MEAKQTSRVIRRVVLSGQLTEKPDVIECWCYLGGGIYLSFFNLPTGQIMGRVNESSTDCINVIYHLSKGDQRFDLLTRDAL